jgi:hypothetical protein
MIKLQTATKRTGKIRKGERYLAFTGRDAEKVRTAASKLGITPERAADNGLVLFLQKGSVTASTIEMSD